MKSTVLIVIALIAVAAAAFFGGQLYQKSAEPETEMTEMQAAEPETPPVSEAPVTTPPSQPAAPARRPASPAVSQPEAPMQSPAPTPATAPEPAQAQPEPPAPQEPEPVKIRLAEGTKIVFALNNALSTKTSQTGDPFSGRVSQDVRVGSTLAIPSGAIIRGVVGRVDRPGRVQGRAQLGLRFDEVEMPDGETYPISASLTELDETRKEEVTEEGQVKGEGTKKRDAATIGAGAGIGAVIGAISGGGKGAGTGAAVGAGAGTAVVLLTRGKDIELRRGTELALQLDRPLSVTLK